MFVESFTYDSVAFIARIVKSAITLCVLSLLLTACRHVAPERSSTEAEIRQHIAGEWTFSDRSNGSWFPKMTLTEDGNFTVVRTDGTRAQLGTWECQSGMLKVTRTPASDSSARASAWLLNDWDYFPVIYADDHELVMTPGISVAGRLRFTR
jgi:hypothetical protein